MDESTMTTKEMVEYREGELANLTMRQDEDKELYYLAKYKMKYLDGKEVPEGKVHNVTLPDPALFAYRANAIIASAIQQIVVKGKGMSDAETSYIEDFISAVLYEIDSKLGDQGTAGHFPFNTEQMDIRGRCAARFLFRKEKGKLVADYSRWDTRFVTFRYDRQGLKWAALKTPRCREDIISEYPNADVQGESEYVIDWWGRKKNEVWIGSNIEHTRGHDYGEVPVVYSTCPAGSMLFDSDAISHEGESLFALVRDIYPELNKAASVLQTLNMMSFQEPMQYESEEGETATLPEKPPYGVGMVVAVEKGGGFKKMPVEDMRNATRHLLAMLEGRSQRGTLPAVDYGNLTFPLSAVAIGKLTESKDVIFVPRLSGLAMFYCRLARMMIRQYLMRGMASEFGEEGNRKLFSVDKLKGSYSIKFRYYSQSPEQQIANYAVGSAAHNMGMSLKTVFTDILKLPNPMGEILARKAEDAENLDPILKLHNYTLSLLEQGGRDIDAMILSDQVVAMIKQRRIGMANPAQAATGEGKTRQIGQGEQLVPLLTQGNGGRRLGINELEPAEQAERGEEKKAQMAEVNRTRREGEKGV
jgi:hypothetical protein